MMCSPVEIVVSWWFHATISFCLSHMESKGSSYTWKRCQFGTFHHTLALVYQRMGFYSYSQLLRPSITGWATHQENARGTSYLSIHPCIHINTPCVMSFLPYNSPIPENPSKATHRFPGTLQAVLLPAALATRMPESSRHMGNGRA